MTVAIVSCDPCGDEWHLPSPDSVREECRECGAALAVEEVSVV